MNANNVIRRAEESDEARNIRPQQQKDIDESRRAEESNEASNIRLQQQKDINESKFINLLNKIFEDKNEYYEVKNNLIELTREDSWQKNKIKLTDLLNEN